MALDSPGNGRPAGCSVRCDVILTDAGNEVGYQVLRLLTKAGFAVVACDRIPESLSRHRKYAVDVRRTLAAQDEKNFIKQIRRLEQETGARIIIPVFYAEILSRHRDEFNAVIPTAPSETLITLDDKVKACSLAASLGIPQPRMYSSPSEVDKFPVVFKRASGHSGDSVYFPKTLEPLEHLVEHSVPGTWLISEEIEGFDASVDAIRWNGVFNASAYKVLYPRAKGISIIRRSIDAPLMVDIARKILDAVDYQGVCGFDFRVTPDGKVYFIECNPRFTGGVRSAAASGLNLPVMLCHLVLRNSYDMPHRALLDRMPGKPANKNNEMACWNCLHIKTGVITIVWTDLFRRIKLKLSSRKKAYY